MLALDAEPNAIGGTVTVAQTAEAAGRLNMATGSLPLIYMNRYGPDQRGTVSPIMSYRAARSGCPPTARGRFVHPVGRNGRSGSTPMGTSVPMWSRSQASAGVTAADLPARSPISSPGGKIPGLMICAKNIVREQPASGQRRGCRSWYRI